MPSKITEGLGRYDISICNCFDICNTQLFTHCMISHHVVCASVPDTRFRINHQSVQAAPGCDFIYLCIHSFCNSENRVYRQIKIFHLLALPIK